MHRAGLSTVGSQCVQCTWPLPLHAPFLPSLPPTPPPFFYSYFCFAAPSSFCTRYGWPGHSLMRAPPQEKPPGCPRLARLLLKETAPLHLSPAFMGHFQAALCHLKAIPMPSWNSQAWIGAGLKTFRGCSTSCQPHFNPCLGGHWDLPELMVGCWAAWRQPVITRDRGGGVVYLSGRLAKWVGGAGSYLRRRRPPNTVPRPAWV